MSSMVKPVIATFECSAAISKGNAVKFGSSNKIVTKASATTDKLIGIAQNTVTTAGDLVEVAMPGGGGKALAKTTIALGDLLGVNADGSIQKVANAGDRVIGIAMDSAAANDIFAVHVIAGHAYAAQS